MEDKMSSNANTNLPPAPSVEDLIDLKAIQIEPNQCPLSAPLALTLKFTVRSSTPIKAAFWTLSYEADVSMKRHVIPLLTTAPAADLQPGEHVFQQKIDKIPTEGVKEKYLLQVGMLKLALRSAAASETEPLVSINMVTQVSKDEKGELIRNVISPLEE